METENPSDLDHSVFRVPIPIFLEIFSYLKFKQLITIQRVCKHWRNIIRENQSLFETLFIRNFPSYVDDKPADKSWQEFYLETVSQSLYDSINSAEHKREFFTGKLTSYSILIGIRAYYSNAQRNSPANETRWCCLHWQSCLSYDLHSLPLIYKAYLEKEIQSYINETLQKCSILAEYYRSTPFIESMVMSQAIGKPCNFFTFYKTQHFSGWPQQGLWI